MATPRTMKHYGVFGGPADVYVSDDWRGLDMWVGDIDRGAAGPPEIVITHDEVKDDDNPASDVFSSGRVLRQLLLVERRAGVLLLRLHVLLGRLAPLRVGQSGNQGQGKYKFDPNFFPRKSGPVVPQGGVPGGGTIPRAARTTTRSARASSRRSRASVSRQHHRRRHQARRGGALDKVVQRRAKINDRSPTRRRSRSASTSSTATAPASPT